MMGTAGPGTGCNCGGASESVQSVSEPPAVYGGSLQPIPDSSARRQTKSSFSSLLVSEPAVRRPDPRDGAVRTASHVRSPSKRLTTVRSESSPRLTTATTSEE